MSRYQSLPAFLAVLAFFFVSGACGLLYQVVWTRQFVLLFGASSYAVSTVLSVFFLGLGAGSLWGGRLADRVQRPLRVYGLFEIVIGVWAVLLTFGLAWGESAVVALLQTFGASRASAIGARALLALVFLIVPVTLMGATLPLLAKFVTREGRVRGLPIGALYTVNTFGAVTGCALAGFVLIAALGYRTSAWTGAAANIAIGLLAIMMGARDRNTAVNGSVPEEPSSTANARMRYMVIAAFAVSGFCALALEVVWTRLLVLVFLGTTYAFTTMLATLLCGIAVGSAVASGVVDRIRHHAFFFAMAELLLGVSCILMLRVFASMPERLQAMQVDMGYDWGGIVRAKCLLTFSALFLPTFLSGMTFPLAVRAVTGERGHLGRDVGRLYSANTFGGVLGALAGGFLLLPMLGAHQSIVLLGSVLCGVGALVVIAAPGRSRMVRVGAAAAGLLLLGYACHGARGWDVARMLTTGYVPQEERVLHFREGVEATVAVSEPKDNPIGTNRTLWVNAVQATASIEKGVKMNRLQGVLPMLFDRDPRRVLFMCFGSGITAGTLGLWDFERIDAVEIARDVLDAAPLFAADNFDVLHNPKVHFIIDDGRNFLLTARDRYDVVTFEPMPLALAGVSAFYTREYYRLCLDRLAPGGIVSQWVPLHSLDTEVVRSLTYTFTQVFPEYCAWFVNADLFLIGSNEPLRIDYARVRERLQQPRIALALEEVGLRDIPEVLTCFFMGKEKMRAFAEGGSMMTDDRPWAEFTAPKLMYERTVEHALRTLAPYCESPAGMLDLDGVEATEQPAALDRIERRAKAKAHDLIALEQYYAGAVDEKPENLFIESLEIDPDDYNARYYVKQIALTRAELAVRWDEPENAIAILEKALKYAPDQPELHRMLAEVLRARSAAAER